MAEFRALFDIQGSSYSVTALDQRLISPIRGLLGELEIQDEFDGPSIGRMETSRVDGLPDFPANGIHHICDVEEMGQFEFCLTSTHWTLKKENQIFASCYLDGSRCNIYALHDTDDLHIGLAQIFALDLNLAQQGHAILHSACLDVPGGNARIVIFAPSGVGKTTTALSLMGAGFKLCSDDATILKSDKNQTPTAWGLPRALNVHKKTFDLVDWIRPMKAQFDWTAKDENSLTHSMLADRISTSKLVPKPVLGFFAIRRGEPAEPSHQQLAKSETLMAMIKDNIARGAQDLFPSHNKKLDVYANAISHTPCFEVVLCEDPGKNAASFAQLVGMLGDKVEKIA